MIEARICHVGGGGALWAVTLMRDLALEPGLGGELRLYDIDHEAAKVNQRLGEALFAHPEARSRFEVTVADTASEALSGTDIVVMSIEPGPVECRFADLVIPARRGIIQTVGDSVGPGGIARAWRAVPTFLDYAKLIATHAPEAWVINHTNPLTICTAALYHGFPGIKAVGCCHEVLGSRNELMEFMSNRGIDRPETSAEIHVEVTGLNHFTFATRITYADIDLVDELRRFASEPASRKDLTARARERMEQEAWFDNDHRIALEFLRTCGAFGMAGDRHLAEFVPWFLQNEADLNRYGVIVTPYEWRKRRDDERALRNPAEEAETLARSEEEGVPMFHALLGGPVFRTNVNVPNSGQIDWLPPGHPVETFAAISSDSVVPERPAPLPDSIREVQRRAAAVQEITLQASIERDRAMLLEAMLLDPLVNLSLSDTSQMLDDMLDHIESVTGKRMG
jgi:alpha-galactosidase/6-phospho-beta-glucosidase family protein